MPYPIEWAEALEAWDAAVAAWRRAAAKPDLDNLVAAMSYGARWRRAAYRATFLELTTPQNTAHGA